MSDQKHDENSPETGQEDVLADTSSLLTREVPAGVRRRDFLIRSAVGGAAAVMTGCAQTPEEKTAKALATSAPAVAPSAPPLAEDLYVVMASKGPVMTTADEFYKVGPGPSSSHTIGPMRIT